MKGITYLEKFLSESHKLFEKLQSEIVWDERMRARKTASYGKAYNYSQINYPYQEFLPELGEILTMIAQTLHFEPNNCLINYYLDGKSKMGFHSDQTDILADQTGIAIVSIGETRVLRFRKITDHQEVKDYTLPSGSLIYMTQEIQQVWQHAIPKSDTDQGRMSLTYRRLLPGNLNE